MNRIEHSVNHKAEGGNGSNEKRDEGRSRQGRKNWSEKKTENADKRRARRKDSFFHFFPNSAMIMQRFDFSVPPSPSHHTHFDRQNDA